MPRRHDDVLLGVVKNQGKNDAKNKEWNRTAESKESTGPRKDTSTNCFFACLVTITATYADFYIALERVLHAFGVMVHGAIEFLTAIWIELFIALTSIEPAGSRYDLVAIAVYDAEIECITVHRVNHIDGNIP